MKVDFRRLTWENYPSTETPINADNLNRLEEGVAGLYSDVAEIEQELGGGVGEYVSDWLNEHVDPVGSAVVVDDTLSIEGAAADAKKTGDELTSLKEDLSNTEEELWSWNETFDKAKEKFNPTDIVGNNYAFHSGYVGGVELSVNAISGNDATLFITDTNRMILYKTTKKISANDLVIPVNQYIATDFYVLVSYSGIFYYNSSNVYSNKWMGVSFATYGSYFEGETMPDFNNNGRIGFALKVKYLTTKGQIIKNEGDIHSISYEEVKIVSEGTNAHFSITDAGILYARKTGNVSGCLPCFFNKTEEIAFTILRNPVWMIVSKDSSDGFIGLGFQGTGIIVASFNADGSVKKVDYNTGYFVSSWVGSVMRMVWEDEYFLSIYRNGRLIWKIDYRHTDDGMSIHQMGAGIYSNQEAGSLIEFPKIVFPYGYKYDEVNVLGDSFTDNTRDALGTGTFYFTRWYEYAKTLCDIKTVNNYGFGGTCLSPVGSGDNSFYTRMQNMKQHVSLVFVQGGTNDYHFDVPLGTINDDTTDTFYGTLNKMCDYLVNYYYDAGIVFCTPIMRVSPAQNKTEAYPANNQTNNLNLHLEDYVNAMIETCAKWAIPCVDMYHESKICPQNRNSMNFARFMNDGIHLNQYGHRQMGTVFGQIAKMYI